MLKATELRKGCFAINPELDIFKKGYVTMEARWIYEMAVFESAQTCADYASKFEPIPLTAEWLLRFGFTKSTGGADFHIGELKEPLYERELSLFYHVKYGFCYRNYLHQIECVHELQNLYFCLNKKELILQDEVKSK